MIQSKGKMMIKSLSNKYRTNLCMNSWMIRNCTKNSNSSNGHCMSPMYITRIIDIHSHTNKHKYRCIRCIFVIRCLYESVQNGLPIISQQSNLCFSTQTHTTYAHTSFTLIMDAMKEMTVLSTYSMFYYKIQLQYVELIVTCRY